ncbi:MAG: AI-2E family transporter [Lachnospiraceae bacterium]|nr:AI-2E family transporter [Lachnospiraceae bacterium]
MRERKQNIRTILAIITFTLLLAYLINHTGVIFGVINKLIALLFPFLIGCGMAFVINIPMRGIENKFFKNPNSKLYKARRPISMVASYVLFLLVIVLVIFVVVPEVADTLLVIRDKFPAFVSNAKSFLIKYTEKFPEITETIMNVELDWDKITGVIFNSSSSIIESTVSLFSSFISAVVNVIVGIVFSAYILSQKEKLSKQVKMFIYAMYKESTADELMVFGKIANTTFSKFFTCQFREGIILGTMIGVTMAVIGMPYPLTTGVLIAFTALIPIFGAFIGLAICGFLILVDTPSMLIGFVILFFVIQFIENYFIYPKLVGGDIGLSAIWVLLAVLVGGDLMGVVGMLIFIPLVSVFYSYMRSIIYRKLKKKNIDVDKKQVPDNVMPLMEGRRRLFSARGKAEGKKDDNNEDTVVEE